MDIIEREFEIKREEKESQMEQQIKLDKGTIIFKEQSEIQI